MAVSTAETQWFGGPEGRQRLAGGGASLRAEPPDWHQQMIGVPEVRKKRSSMASNLRYLSAIQVCPSSKVKGLRSLSKKMRPGRNLDCTQTGLEAPKNDGGMKPRTVPG